MPTRSPPGWTFATTNQWQLAQHALEPVFRNLLFDRGSATGVTGCEWLQGNMRCSCWCLAAVFTLLQRRTNTTRAKTMLRNGTFFQSYTSKVSARSAGACLSGCGRGCGGPPANKKFSKTGVCLPNSSNLFRTSQCIAAHLSTSLHLESRNLLLFKRDSCIRLAGCK